MEAGDRIVQVEVYQMFPTRMQRGWIGRLGTVVSAYGTAGPPVRPRLTVRWDGEPRENIEANVPREAVRSMSAVDRLAELADAGEG